MLFPTTVFAIFFAIVYTIYWSIPERSRIRKYALLAASVFFYGYWHWGFAMMMLFSAAINHGYACMIARAPEKSKKNFLVQILVINLFALAFFKYTGFLFADCFLPLAVPLCKLFGATDALIAFNERALPFIQTIVLPVGISFYTFQAIAYVSDVATGKFRPAKTLLDFANYLSFFPKLAAGPIARPFDLVPQMEELPLRSTPINSGKAATLILGGLFKKMVVANWLSAKLADPLFQFPEDYGMIDAFLGTYGYAIQIYCDFSAYSDMATGCALLLGFTFHDNFRAPYIASSFQDFWRRWHITLSTWLRDYLYIPLGGSRCSKIKIYRNLILTMLIGGLWHGAGFSYIIWGAIHGIVQVIERPFNKVKKIDLEKWNIPRILRTILTFNVVTFAWIFFRAGAADVEGLATVNEILKAFTRVSMPSELFSPLAIIMLLLGFALQIFDGNTMKNVWARFNKLHPVLQGLIAALILAIILGLGPQGVAPFIYFQF